MGKAGSSRLKFLPLVFFPSRADAFAALGSRDVPAAHGTAPLPAASGIPSLLRAGCAPVTSFDGSSPPAGPHRADKKLL